MDAHVIRRISESIAPILLGARIEKIHALSEDVHVITLYAQGHKRYLYVRHGRRHPMFFIASHKPQAPQTPSAMVMRLRKYLSSRRITEVESQWLERRIALKIAGESPLWLIIDSKKGLWLSSTCPDYTPAEWPALDMVMHPRGEESPLWRAYPVMTPPLRRSLACMESEDAAALMIDLESGGGDLFLYYDAGQPIALSAWPLPYALRKKITSEQKKGNLQAELKADSHAPAAVTREESLMLTEKVYDSKKISHEKTGNKEFTLDKEPVVWEERIIEDALYASELFGTAIVLEGLVSAEHKDAAKPFSAEANRLRKLLQKLEAEERRLTELVQRREAGKALQRILYLYPADAKMSSIQVPAWEEPFYEEDGSPRMIPLTLDMRKTIRENMADLFHQARRGARGLDMLAQRRESVALEIALAEQRALQADVALESKSCVKKKGQQGAVSSSKPRNQVLPAKNVQLFRSSDGVRLLRGRNAEGNAMVLRAAQPYDIWLHAAEGPSAHLIIKRDHSAQDIPETTLIEAGILVGLKSWQRDDAQARIMYAYVKDVRPVKGAAAGAVRVEKTWTDRIVRLDASLEEQLAES